MRRTKLTKIWLRGENSIRRKFLPNNILSNIQSTKGRQESDKIDENLDQQYGLHLGQIFSFSILV